MLLEAWQDFESQYGDQSSRTAVSNLLPKRVKKRRRIQTQDGVQYFFKLYLFVKNIILKCIHFSERCWLGRVLRLYFP
jgi:hypothetical protein